MKLFLEMTLVLAVFPGLPLGCCWCAEVLAARVENSLPPCGE